MSKLKVIRIHSDMGDTRIIAREIITDRFLKGYMLYRPFFQTIDENDWASFETEISLYISQVCKFHEHPALMVAFEEEGCLGVLITASVDVFIEDLQTVTHTRPEEKNDTVEAIDSYIEQVRNICLTNKYIVLQRKINYHKWHIRTAGNDLYDLRKRMIGEFDKDYIYIIVYFDNIDFRDGIITLLRNAAVDMLYERTMFANDEHRVKYFKLIDNDVKNLRLAVKYIDVAVPHEINLEKSIDKITDKFNRNEHFLLKRRISQPKLVNYIDDTWILVHAANSYHQIENFFRNRCNEGKNIDNNDFIYCYATKEECKLLKVQENLFRIECTAKLINAFIDNGVVSDHKSYMQNVRAVIETQEVIFIEFEADKHETV